MSENQPVNKVRIGPIEAAIWENRGEKGTFHSVTFSRSYKKNEEWKNTDSFRAEDLLLLSKTAEKAFDWLYENDKI